LLISGHKQEIKIKKKNNITFGILFFIFFLIIGLYPLKSDEIIRVWFVVLSLVFLIITIIRPNLFTFLNKLWIKFGILLGKIISPIVMGLVFFFVVTPIGILIRILKKDVMGLKRGKSSYWINRENKFQTMKKQF
jgi:energy-coupling factor transporter transmembrane protein EcfT